MCKCCSGPVVDGTGFVSRQETPLVGSNPTYSTMIKNRKRIVTTLGYVMYWKPEHSKADKQGSFRGYCYEHILVAERTLGRPLEPDEEVHHLDFFRANNTPRNLLVLRDSEHSKLHAWLRETYGDPVVKQLTYSDNKNKRFLKACSRCAYCKWPMARKRGTCSLKCFEKLKAKKDEHFRELLEKLINRNLPWTQIGKRLSMTDNGARKIGNSARS